MDNTDSDPAVVLRRLITGALLLMLAAAAVAILTTGQPKDSEPESEEAFGGTSMHFRPEGEKHG